MAVVNEIFHLAKGEDMHFANRAKSLHNIDKVEVLTFVGNNRANSQRNILQLRRIFNELTALAD